MALKGSPKVDCGEPYHKLYRLGNRCGLLRASIPTLPTCFCRNTREGRQNRKKRSARRTRNAETKGGVKDGQSVTLGGPCVAGQSDTLSSLSPNPPSSNCHSRTVSRTVVLEDSFARFPQRPVSQPLRTGGVQTEETAAHGWFKRQDAHQVDSRITVGGFPCDVSFLAWRSLRLPWQRR